MHEVRFPNISILSHIVCYVPSLTIIIAVEIKAAGFSKVRQISSNIFSMHYADIKDKKMNFFHLGFYYFSLENLSLHG